MEMATDIPNILKGGIKEKDNKPKAEMVVKAELIKEKPVDEMVEMKSFSSINLCVM